MVDNEIIRVALHYAMAGASDVMNVFHFLYDGTGDLDGDILDDIETWLINVWGDQWKTGASDDAEMLYADVDVVATDGTVVRNIGIATAAIEGVIVADEVPVATAGFIMADTGFPKNRGKKYLPGMAEGNVVDGFVAATQLARHILLLVIWVTAITAPTNGSLVPGVLSLTKAAFLAFTGSGLATDVPAYQRRRKINVGA